jgi:hypothetical protein
MDRLQLMMAMMALSDPSWRDDRPDRRRELTAEQLDAIADFPWPFTALKRFIADWSNAIHARWREASQERRAESPLASADAQ